MIDESQTGISEVLIERFERERFPRMLNIKEHVDNGFTLEEVELEFLQRVLNDAQKNYSIVNSIPDCRDLFARVIHLYHDITARALENEEKRNADD